jgi:hypothetical protein
MIRLLVAGLTWAVDKAKATKAWKNTLLAHVLHVGCLIAGRRLDPSCSGSSTLLTKSAANTADSYRHISNSSSSSTHFSRTPSSYSSSCHTVATAADVLTGRSTGGCMPASHTRCARHHPHRHTNVRWTCERSHNNEAPQSAQPRAAAYTQVRNSLNP